MAHAPALQGLALGLANNTIGDCGAQALAELQNLREVWMLALMLAVNKIGPTGAQTLASLKAGPALEVLGLDLLNNCRIQRFKPSGASRLPRHCTLWC